MNKVKRTAQEPPGAPRPLRIAAGKTGLETMAIRSHLERLGLASDLEGGTLSPEMVSRSKIAGGLTAVKALGVDTLDLEALEKLEEKLGTRRLGRAVATLFGKDQPNIARQTLRSSVKTMDGLRQQLDRFVASKNWSYEGLASLLRRTGNLPRTFEAVERPEILSHLGRAELNELRSAYARLLATVARHESQIVSFLNDEVRPKLYADAGKHDQIVNVAFGCGPLPVEVWSQVQAGMPFSPRALRAVIAAWGSWDAMIKHLVERKTLYA